MFHVVVDNDDTVERILEVLTRERSGRVTFMPLNRLQPREVTYPNEDVVPLISKLKFDERFRPAFAQVFGKTVVCPNLQVGNSISRSHDLNAITLDGDRVDRKGALTGGFHDTRQSRIDVIHVLRSSRSKLATEQTQFDAIKTELAEIEQECTRIQTTLTNTEAKRRRLLAERDPLQRDLASKQRDTEALRSSLTVKGKSLEALKEAIVALERESDALKQELQSPHVQSLASEELKELEDLNRFVMELQSQVEEATNKRVKLEKEKMAMENELEIHLERRRDDLHEQLGLLNLNLEGGPSDSVENANSRRDELNRLKRSILSIETRIQGEPYYFLLISELMFSVGHVIGRCQQ